MLDIGVLMKCIIIGAGPSGLAAGIQLLLETQKQKATCECIIFEKDPLQAKPCGGLITPKSKEILNQLDIPTSILHPCSNVTVEYKGASFSYPTTESFFICNRSDLICELNKKYLSLGGKLVWEEVIDIKSNMQQVSTINGVYNYDILIIASGYQKNDYSPSYRRISQRSKVSIGLSAIIPPHPPIPNDNKIRIWFTKALEGYCWCFPLPNGNLNVGFAGKISKAPQNDFLFIREQFNDILQIESVPYRGRILPIDDYEYLANNATETKDKVYRIGEAGGYFDSLTGEGVYFALYTGILTAKYITGVVGANDYQKARKLIARICKGSSFTRRLLFGKWLVLPVLLSIARITKKLDTHMTENLILRYQYDYYSAFLSPLFCYTNQTPPFNNQRILDYILQNSKED